MARATTHYVCSGCGHESAKWHGRCPGCEEWSTLVEEARPALYVSGEESAAQVRLRAERLGEAALQVPIVAETDLEAVVATIEAERPDVCVVDSVQVLHSPDLTGAPGSVGQVREVAGRLMRVAKE